MKLNKYNCPQQDLYTIVYMGWKSCRKKLSAFTDFKPVYTDAYIDEKIAQADAAEKMPSEQERDGKISSLRLHLLDANQICLTNFQSLKRYIDTAFTPKYAGPEYATIGNELYSKALHKNWDTTKSIMTKCSTYIAQNVVKLSENLNMPPSFPAKFESDLANFNTLHHDFLEAEESALDQTKAKIDANNAIYTDLMAMFADAQILFKNEDALLKQFTFSDVLYLVSGAGTAGIRGAITNTANNKAVKEVTITVDETQDTTITDETGKYEISPMASGNYTLLISAPGFESQTISHEVLVGTISTLNITLNPSAVTV
ncbi:MAG: carboxypeptidase regulatory-like domain-containing protein [Chitinophagaceae bacterium]|nr:carboxypeptidase regulatory-like domain-containing protein [Chitinophagaceae bacterium]